MVGWYHWLNGREFEQTLGDGDGQGSLTCYSPWGRKESDTTERLNIWAWAYPSAGRGEIKVRVRAKAGLACYFRASQHCSPDTGLGTWGVGAITGRVRHGVSLSPACVESTGVKCVPR